MNFFGSLDSGPTSRTVLDENDLAAPLSWCCEVSAAWFLVAFLGTSLFGFYFYSVFFVSELPWL